jgi:hypothetical protein
VVQLTTAPGLFLFLCLLITVAHASDYEWIKRGLLRNGLEASPFTIALAWNAGLTAVIERRVPAVSRGYASRVVNRVDDLAARQMAAAAH